MFYEAINKTQWDTSLSPCFWEVRLSILSVCVPWLTNCQIYCTVYQTTLSAHCKSKEHKVKRIIQIPIVHSEWLSFEKIQNYNLTYTVVYFSMKVQTWNYFCKQYFVLLNNTIRKAHLHHIKSFPTYVYLKINENHILVNPLTNNYIQYTVYMGLQ